MDTRKYLDAVRRKIGAESNAEVARALGLSRAAMTKYYNGERIIDDYTAARVAEVLGIDPLTVIAQANAEREKDGDKRQFWERLAHAAVVVLACGSLFVSGVEKAEANQSVTGVDAPVIQIIAFTAMAPGTWNGPALERLRGADALPRSQQVQKCSSTERTRAIASCSTASISPKAIPWVLSPRPAA